MNGELVKRLRECVSGECWNCSQHKDSYDGQRTCADNLMKQSADAIEQLSNAGSAYGRGWTLGYDAGRKESNPRWIPVTERLPKEETPVQVTYLGYNDKKPRTDMIACLYCGYWCYWDGAPYSYNKCKVEVTHWMPLQPAPKEE